MPEAEARVRAGPPATLSVAIELARALGGLALFPFRLALYLARRKALSAELLADLSATPKTVPARGAPRLVRAPRVFVSCAEASGEVHVLNTLRALRIRCAELGVGEPLCTGLGGDRLRAAGVRTLGDPVQRAAMGFSAVLGSLPFYLRLLRTAAAHFRDERPDVCVLVDSPALHVPLGRIARRAGVPVVHFVTPQHWGWAPWRARGYASAVDRALTILPFEQAWFARRGVPTLHVGHPLLDALSAVPASGPDKNSRAIALLPGSRRKVIERNLPWMLARLAELREHAPDLTVVLPHGRAELGNLLRAHVDAAGAAAWVRIETGDLHESLRHVRAAFSVSGTVLLDLLHHRLPTVVVYRLSGTAGPWMYEHLLTPPWFASINLLAGREVVPEFCFAGEGPKVQVRAALARAFDDPAWRADCQRGLELAARRLGPPGACDLAALEVLQLAAARIGSNTRPA
ncbi:MAG TPA: hypothetical protein VM509_05150 [Planctomycetota bacterium]|nr:hypothetical protein [Planctomycetota bacterium]